MAEREKAVRELVARSCLAMDDQDFHRYLALCHPDFRYVISTYSPELRRDIVWLDHDKPQLKTLFDVLPLHANDHHLRFRLSRHVSVYTVDYSADGARAAVASGLQVFTTALDGGATALLGTAKLRDTVALAGGKALLVAREVRLDTRMLGETGSLVPF